MSRGSITAALSSAAVWTLSSAAFSQTPGAAEPAPKPAAASAKKTGILVARPNDASMEGFAGNSWYGPLSEALLYFRLGAVDGVEVAPRDSLQKAFSGFNDPAKLITEEQYAEWAAKRGISFVIFQSFEAREREAQVLAELFSVKAKKSVATFEKTVAVESVPAQIDSCLRQFLAAAKIPLGERSTRFFRTAAVSPNAVGIKQLADIIQSELYGGAPDPAGTAGRYKAIVSRDGGMQLAKYLGALDFVAAKNYGEAAVLLDGLLISVGPYADLYTIACRSYRQAKRPSDAIRMAILAEKAGTVTTELLVEKARAQQESGAGAKIAETYQRILERNPRQPDALLYFAQLANKEKEPSKALTYADRLLSDNPDNAPACLEKGKALVALQRRDEALTALKKASTLLPKDPVAPILLGDIYMGKKDYDNASKSYQAALQAKPDDFDVIVKAARALTRGGQRRQALSLLKKGESLFGSYAVFHKEVGLLDYQLSENADARLHLEAFVKSGEKDTAVLMTLATLYTKDGASDNAIALYNQALPIVTNKNDCRMALAKLYLAKNDPKSALPHLEAVAREKPSYPGINGMLGDAWLATGNKEKALAAYVSERAFTKADQRLQENIARLSYETGNFSQAKTENTELTKAGGKAADEANWRLCLIYLREKTMEKAEEYLKKSLAAGRKPDAGVYCDFARAYSGLQMHTKAVDAFQKCLDAAPGNESALKEMAEAQIAMKRDSAAAESYVALFGLNNDKNSACLVKAGALFEQAKAKDRAAKVYGMFIDKKYSNPDVNVRLARFEYDAKNYAKVISLLAGVPPSSIADERMHMMLAESYFLTDHFAEAQPWLGKIIAKSPASARAVELSALCYEKAGNLPSACRMYESYLALPGVPRKGEYGPHLAELYEKQNMRSAAIARYQKNAVAYPTDAKSFERLGTMHFEAKEYSAALPHLQRAASLTGASPAVKKLLARTMVALNNPSGAVGVYTQYLKAVPDDSSALFELGMLYYGKKNYVKAVEPLSAASVFMTRNFACSFSLGAAYLQLNDPARAASPLARASTIEPANVQALSALAKAYRLTKDDKSLLPVLEKWAAVEPNNYDVQREFGALLVAQGNSDRATGPLEAAGRLRPSDVKTHVLLADIYKKKGNNPQRLSHLNDALKYAPAQPDVLVEIGRFYVTQKDYAKAEGFFDKAVDLNPRDAPVRYEYGTVLLNQAKAKNACPQFAAAVQADPNNTAYVVGLAQASYQAGDKKTASQAANKALSLSAGNPDALMIAATLAFESGDAARAKDLFLTAVQINKDCSQCYENLGDIFLAENNTADAIKNLDRALEIDGNNVHAGLKLAKAYYQSGQQERAQHLFEQALGQDPRNDDALYLLCHIYLQSGKTALADIVLQKRPEGKRTASYYVAAGEVFEAKNQVNAALDAYNTALRLAPDNGPAHAGVGRLDLAKGNYDAAIVDLSNAMAYDAQNPRLMVDLAKAYEGNKDLAAARDVLIEAAKLDTRNADIFYYLARVEGKLGEHLKSVEALKKGLEIDPKSLDLQMALGHEYRLTSLFDDAIEAYKKAARMEGKDAVEAYKYIGNVYFSSLRDKDKAKEYYERYVKEGGTDPAVAGRLKTY